MKTYIATIEVEMGCVNPGIIYDRVMSIPFGDNDLGFRIVSIKEGTLPPGTDETYKAPYTTRHGLITNTSINMHTTNTPLQALRRICPKVKKVKHNVSRI